MATTLSYVKYWTDEILDRFFTTEAMSKTKSDFNQVHLPIERILVDNRFPAGRGKTVISENELRDIVIRSRPGNPNRIFILVGETGSGKSELCQWLYYNISDQEHFPILIPRKMVHLRDIVAEIHRHLDEPLPDKVRNLTDLWPEVISAKLRAGILEFLQQENIQNRLGQANINTLRRILDNQNFEKRMRDNVIRYQAEMQRLEAPRNPDFLTRQDFTELIVNDGLYNADLAYEMIQHSMNETLANQLGVEDFIQKLERIAEMFRRKEKRPVLLIEDITTLGFLHNNFLDYLFNLERGNFDVVIGVTNDFERGRQNLIYSAEQTIQERIEGRFELTDEKSETLFLKDRFQELTKRYLEAVRATSYEDPYIKRHLDPIFGEGLYPFNDQFLRHIYEGLKQDDNPKRTPRLFLRVLRDVLTSSEPPYSALEINANVDLPVTFFSQTQNISTEAAQVIRWYGKNTNRGIFLDKRIAKIFNIQLPAGIDEDQNYYRLNLRPGAETQLPEPDFTFQGCLVPSEEPKNVVRPLQTPPPLSSQSPTLDAIAQLDIWLINGRIFPERNKLKDGFIKLLDFYELQGNEIKHPDSIAQSGRPLLFERFDKYSRIYLRDSGDNLRDSQYKLNISPDLSLHDQFSQVLAVGQGHYQVNEISKLDHVLLYEWLSSEVKLFRRRLRKAVESAIRMPLEHFIAFAKFLLLNSALGIDNMDPEQLAQTVQSDPLVINFLDGFTRPLFDIQDHIQGLFVAFFHLRDNLVDFNVLKRVCESVDPVRMLNLIRSIDPKAVPDGFLVKVGQDALTFRKLVEIVQRYTNRLILNIDFPLNPDKITLKRMFELCSPPEAIDVGRLRNQLNDLHQKFITAGLRWNPVWDLELITLNKENQQFDFALLHRKLARLLGKLEDSPQMNIFEKIALNGMIQREVKSPEFEVILGIEKLDAALDRSLRSIQIPAPELDSRYQKFSAIVNHVLKQAKLT